MGLGSLITHDAWEEPTESDFENSERTVLIPIMQSVIHSTLDPTEAPQQYGQTLDTIRWYVAFDIDGWTTRKRRWAQQRVADDHDVRLETVQRKIRNIYSNQTGRKSAQELFEDDLERIREQYQELHDTR